MSNFLFKHLIHTHRYKIEFENIHIVYALKFE